MFTIKSSHVAKKLIAGVSTFDILLPTSSKVLKTLLIDLKVWLFVNIFTFVFRNIF